MKTCKYLWTSKWSVKVKLLYVGLLETLKVGLSSTASWVKRVAPVIHPQSLEELLPMCKNWRDNFNANLMWQISETELANVLNNHIVWVGRVSHSFSYWAAVSCNLSLLPVTIAGSTPQQKSHAPATILAMGIKQAVKSCSCPDRFCLFLLFSYSLTPILGRLWHKLCNTGMVGKISIFVVDQVTFSLLQPPWWAAEQNLDTNFIVHTLSVLEPCCNAIFS